MYHIESSKEFYKEKLSLIFKLLSLFIILSLGVGILLEEFLNTIEIFGVKLGFFISNQFIIYIFILLIYIYIKKISKIEKKYEIQ